MAAKCAECRAPFLPKPKGYNARYCSDRCKRRNQRARLRRDNPDQLRNARLRSYRRIKSDPARLKNHRTSGRNGKKSVREWLAEYKRAMGCADCGYRTHAAALQLDHEGKKSVEIADARSSVKRLQNEIAAGQCRVRCANCHAVRTWILKQDI